MTNYKDMPDGEVRRLFEGNEMPKTLPKGHQSILSPTFKYVNAANTDLAKTFARIRGQMILHLEPSHPSPLESLWHCSPQEIRKAAIERAMRNDDE